MKIGKIEKDIPVPTRSARKTVKLLLEGMKVGDSVFIEATKKEVSNIRFIIYGVKSGYKSKVEENGIRIWKTE